MMKKNQIQGYLFKIFHVINNTYLLQFRNNIYFILWITSYFMRKKDKLTINM